MPCASLHLPACPPPPQTRQESFSGPLCPHFTWPGCSFLPGGGQRVAVWVSPPVPQTSAWGQRRLWRRGWWLWGEGEGAGAAGGPAAGSVTVCSLVYSLSPPQVPCRTEHCSCAETCLIHRADCAFGVRSSWSRLHQSRVDAQLGRGHLLAPWAGPPRSVRRPALPRGTVVGECLFLDSLLSPGSVL